MGLYVLYIIAAYVALNTDVLDGVTSKRPEKLMVHWDSGSSFIPGIVHIEGLHVRGQTKKMQWQCRLKEGTFRIALFRLFGKTVRVKHGSGSDFEFYFRRRIAPGEEIPETAGATPEIDGLSNPPDPAPEDIYPPKPKPENPWKIDVTEAIFDGSVDLWFQQLRMRGTGRVGGGVRFEIRSALEIVGAVLDLEGATVSLGDTTFVDDVELDLTANIAPFLPKETHALDILSHFSGSLDLKQGKIPDLAAFNVFLPSGAGIEMVSGDVGVNLSMSAPTPHDASGDVEVAVRDARVILAGKEVGGDITLRASLHHGDLAEGRYDMNPSTLDFENMILPDPKREQREDKLETKEEQLEAKIDAQEEKLEELEDKDTRKARRKAARLEEKQAAAEEELEQLEEAEEDLGWWARIETVGGEVDLAQPGEPMQIDTALSFTMKNTKPLMRLFLSKPTEDGGEKMPMWAKMAPDIKDLQGEVSFDIGPGGMILDDLLITSKPLDMMARMKGADGKVVGQMYIRFRVFHVGIDMGSEKKKVRMKKPKAWYLERPEFDDSTTQRVPEEMADDAPEAEAAAGS